MTRSEARLVGACWALRAALGLGFVLAGFDKFFDFLTTWSMYLSPLVERHLPVAASTFMRGVGVLEVLIGLAVLVGPARLGAYAGSLWLLGIAVNLAITGNFWDLVLRDLQIAVAAFALGRLAAWREAPSPSTLRERSSGPVSRPWGLLSSPHPGIRLVAQWRR